MELDVHKVKIILALLMAIKKTLEIEWKELDESIEYLQEELNKL